MMKMEIDSPYKLNYKIYILIISISLAFVMLSILMKSMGIIAFFADIINSISIGCMASGIVALLIDFNNVQERNKIINDMYDQTYQELKRYIAFYIQEWANIYKYVCKDTIHNQEYTWLEWFEKDKQYFDSLSQKKKKDMLETVRYFISFNLENINKCLSSMIGQKSVLVTNEIYNRKINSILGNFDFEFRALSWELKNKKNNDNNFWRSLSAINNDLYNYIDGWRDIKYYNVVKIKPLDFFDDKNEAVTAKNKNEALKRETSHG